MSGRSQASQLDIRLRRYQALCQVAESIATHRDFASLLKDLKERLQLVVKFDAAQIVLHDAMQNVMRRHVLKSPGQQGEPMISELAVDDAPAGRVWQTQEPLLVNDLSAYEGRYPRSIAELRHYNIQTAYLLPLTSLDRRLGAIGFLSRQEAAWDEDDREFLHQVARLVAVAVDNAINFESARAAGVELTRRLEQLRLMLQVTSAVVAQLELQDLLHVITSSIREMMKSDAAGVALFDEESGVLRAFATDVPPEHPLREKGVPIPLEGNPAGLAFTTGRAVFMDEPDVDRFPLEQSELLKRIYEDGYRSGGSIPLIAQGRKLGILGVSSKRENAFTDDDKNLLCQIANQIAVAVDNALNFARARAAEQEATRHSDRLGLVLRINNAVVAQLELRELLRVIFGCLRGVLQHDTAGIALYDAESDELRMMVTDFPERMGLVEESYVVPIEGSVMGLAFTSGEPVFLDRFDLEKFPSDFTRRSYGAGLRSCGNIPLIAHGRKLGALGVASRREGAFSAEDADLLVQIAKQIAIAVENALNFESARVAEEEATSQSDRRRLLLEINNAVVSTLDLRDLLKVISNCLRRAIPHDAALLTLRDPGSGQLRLQALDLQMFGKVPFEEGVLISLEDTPEGESITSRRPVLVGPVVDLDRYSSPWVRHAVDNGVRSGCVVPLISHDHTLGALSIVSVREDAFTAADVELLGQCAGQIAIAVENALNFERARQAEQEVRRQLERERLMLEVNNAVVSNLDLPGLLAATSAGLRRVLPHDFAGMALYEAGRDHLRVQALDTVRNQEVFGTANRIPLRGTAAGKAFTTRQAVVLPRFEAVESSIPVVQRVLEAGFRSSCHVPLISRDRALGTLDVMSFEEGAFTEADAELLSQVANQIAIAVENSLNFERARVAEQQAKRQSEILQLLLQVNNTTASALDLSSLFRAVSANLRQVFQHDYAVMGLYDEQKKELRAYALERGDGLDFIEEGMVVPLEGTPGGLAVTSRQLVIMGAGDVDRFPAEIVRRAVQQGMRSNCSVPLLHQNRVIGAMSIASKSEAAFTREDGELLMRIAGQIAIAVDNALAYREIESLKNKLASEKLYLEDEIRTEHNFEELIGESRSFKRILKQIETVAPTDSAVLIRGETGTGKELLARAIHDLSARRARTLVKLNCAAIPTGLLESELFGHEKGAFTGAISQRIGRFELANRGTLFLDEVGDIPSELQPKLLRVLQEQEFERLGSTRTLKVDVRLIAATNCDLEQMVAEKKYRSDLYYRLNVFPVTIPPLRERREDIPALARFFTQKYARRLKKPVTAIPTETLAVLTAYNWPGNVRELEHFIERAVILTKGPDLRISPSELKVSEAAATAEAAAPSSLATLQDAERDHILRALEETNWVIGGPAGAAARLGVKRSTLQSRMQKLGIFRRV